MAVVGGIGVAAAGGDRYQELTGRTRDQAGWPPWPPPVAGPCWRSRRATTGAAYGVEVRLADGRQVEVNLNETFRVVEHEADEDKPGENEGR